jgi:hypothetical protein
VGLLAALSLGGCKQGVNDRCEVDTDCQTGLSCRSTVCCVPGHCPGEVADAGPAGAALDGASADQATTEAGFSDAGFSDAAGPDVAVVTDAPVDSSGDAAEVGPPLDASSN